MTHEGGLVSVVWVHGDLVEAGTQVEGTKPCCPGEGIEAGVDPRQRVGVLDRDVIQLPVIDAEPDTPILFASQYDVGGPLAFAGFDYALVLHVGQHFLENRPVCIWNGSQLLSEWSTVTRVYLMLDELRAT